MAKSIDLARLKADLSRYLARVKRGEEIVLTEDGRPLARVVRIEEVPTGRPTTNREYLAALAAKGLVTPGDGRPVRFRPLRGRVGVHLSRAVRTERDERG